MNSSGDTPEHDAIKVEELVTTLNDLLFKIHITIAIHTPLDLTPFLLLGILECILQQRLPIPSTIRESRDPFSKVQAMKIFLGVLEDDVLGEDVGLSDVDPRKLAAGEWDEVVFVGKLLCWLGKRFGIIPLTNIADSRNVDSVISFPNTDVTVDSIREGGSSESVDVRAHAPSPSTHSTVTTRNSLNSTLSMMPTAPPQSDTTVLSVAPESPPSLSELDLFETTIISQVRHVSRTPSPPPLRPRRASYTPRCIHEVEEPSFINLPGHSTIPDDALSESDKSDASESYCDCPSADDSTHAKQRTPVRYEGWIGEADEDLELHSFEASRRASASRRAINTPRTARPSPQAHSTPSPRYPGLSRTSTPRAPPRGAAPGRIITRHNSPTQHTLALLNERAKLMAELAHIKSRR